MSLFSWFLAPAVSGEEVRSEIWKLGGRHLGRPLEGAIEELKAKDLPARRATVLRACIRSLRGG